MATASHQAHAPLDKVLRTLVRETVEAVGCTNLCTNPVGLDLLFLIMTT
jgi:hypothetical protein